jgi:integrase/recombinase XerD
LFFKSTDCLRYSHNSPAHHLVVPVILHLIYTCGLRPIEARRLMTSDVDLETGTIYIRESKGHKDRIIVVSEDMLALCRIYREKMISIIQDSDYFFPSYNGTMYSRYLLDKTFNRCWSSAGILPNVGPSPRVRHEAQLCNKLPVQMDEGRERP